MREGSCFNRQEMNLRKNCRSSSVYLLPLPWGITFVGGLGERDGGSGILISAFGGGSRSLKTGSCTVRLFTVLRPVVVGYTDVEGDGETCFRFLMVGGADPGRRAGENSRLICCGRWNGFAPAYPRSLSNG